MTASLSGRSAIVTGGGTGIGAACATRLAADGMDVTICGRTESKLTAVVDRITASGRRGQGPRPGHRRHRRGRRGRPGGRSRRGLRRPQRLRRQRGWRRRHGARTTCRTRPSSPGCSTSTCSAPCSALSTRRPTSWRRAAGRSSACRRSPGTSPTCGSARTAWARPGIEEMIRNAADEYGAVKVRFNAVRPGFISTEIMEGVPRDSAVYESYLENTPMQDVGEPEDVADLCALPPRPTSPGGSPANASTSTVATSLRRRARLHLVHRAGHRPRRHGRQGRSPRQLRRSSVTQVTS